jgi:hypothetical protein
MQELSNVRFQSLFAHPSVQQMNLYSQVVMADLHACHTARKGYQMQMCNNANCMETKMIYHSCGNRHCPNCGSMKRDNWIDERMSELLPTAYYHVVFTLPHELNPLIMGNRKVLFDTLFSSASHTLINHGNNKEFLGADIGITMVLHTWGQDLSFHPHVHCIVTGGGFDGAKWHHPKRKNNKFLFPEKSLAKMYKAMFMRVLEENSDLKWGVTNKNKLLQTIRSKRWNVYSKAPFGGPAQVLEYLGRYTHKIAITKHRILEMSACQIKFRYKDYADGNKTKEMWLDHGEFVRRFEQHILPRGYVKIRYAGFLRSRDKHQRLAQIRQSMGLSKAMPRVQIPIAIRMLERYQINIILCPCCKTGQLVTIKDTRNERREKQRFFPVKASEIKAAPS